MQPIDLTNQYQYLLDQALVFTGHNKPDAEDLAHDTYIRAVRYLSKFQDGTNLRGWLYTIMHSIFINKFRSQRPTTDIFDINMKSISNAESRLELNHVNRQLIEMGEEKSLALKLYVSGYKYEEIATLTNTPIGTIKTRIYYARKQLRQLHRQ